MWGWGGAREDFRTDRNRRIHRTRRIVNRSENIHLHMLQSIKQLFRPDPSRSFHSNHYLRHTARRLEHLASLGIPIEGKTVLELGAGIGDHTSFFLDRGCEVLTTDSRESNRAILQARYPECKTMVLDLDNPASALQGKFDIVYAYGLLYHLADPAAAIQRLAGWTGGVLLLESCVSPTIHGPNVVRENRNDPTQAQSGTGCRPGRRWLHELLQTHFDHVYCTRTQPRHPEFPLDWGKADDSCLTRSVFACSREPLDLSTLTPDLNTVQLPQV